VKRVGLVVLAALVVPVPAHAEVAFEPMPRRSCNGPATWGQIVSCTKVVEPSAKIGPQPSPHTQVIASEGGTYNKVYLQRADQQWDLVQGLDVPGPGHAVTERAVVVGKHRVLRVDVRVQQRGVMQPGDLLRVTTVFTCGVPDAEACASAVRTCAYYQHGRASSTFLGEASITEAGLAVTGDRSLAGTYCNR
jgi:hypothetical protein